MNLLKIDAYGMRKMYWKMVCQSQWEAFCSGVDERSRASILDGWPDLDADSVLLRLATSESMSRVRMYGVSYAAGKGLTDLCLGNTFGVE